MFRLLCLIGTLSLSAVGMLLSAPAVPAEPLWYLERNQQEVLLWSRARSGSALRELRAQTRINTRLSGVIALLWDTDVHHLWVPWSRQARPLGRRRASELAIEVTLDLPWPLRDSVVALDYRWWQTWPRGVVHVAVSGRPAQGADSRCALQARWSLYPNPDGTVTILHQGHVNPCSQLPAWISNHLLQRALWQMLSNMRQMLHQPRYQSQQVEGMVEPVAQPDPIPADDIKRP